MPLRKNDEDGTYTVFFEETSLVGKDSRRLTFAECKQRLYKRLGFHGIEVLGVKEEEYCYIPMGGELPDLKQRGMPNCWYAYYVHVLLFCLRAGRNAKIDLYADVYFRTCISCTLNFVL